MILPGLSGSVKTQGCGYALGFQHSPPDLHVAKDNEWKIIFDHYIDYIDNIMLGIDFVLYNLRPSLTRYIPRKTHCNQTENIAKVIIIFIVIRIK